MTREIAVEWKASIPMMITDSSIPLALINRLGMSTIPAQMPINAFIVKKLFANATSFSRLKMPACTPVSTRVFSTKMKSTAA